MTKDCESNPKNNENHIIYIFIIEVPINVRKIETVCKKGGGEGAELIGS